jgi:uncharacterized protein YbjT (DUF2867 family)
MSTILVTGGTGALGSQLVPRLTARGRDVRVLSRRGSDTTTVRGDLRTGEGLEQAVAGVAVIAHLASGTGGVPSYKKAKVTDVDGTQRLIDAAKRSGSPHVVYISIVGIDEIPLGYYRAKLDAERLISSSGLPFTILRTTQFHTLAWDFCGQMSRLPAIIVPKGFRSQLVDAGEVADRMTEIVQGPPAGRVPDMGGPEVLEFSDILRRYLRIVGKRRPVAALPLPGRVVRSFSDGQNLAPDHADGSITWDEYLASRAT